MGNTNQAVSATEAIGALREWLLAHDAMLAFLLNGQIGYSSEEHWDNEHRKHSQRQQQAIERAHAVVAAARKHGTRE